MKARVRGASGEAHPEVVERPTRRAAKASGVRVEQLNDWDRDGVIAAASYSLGLDSVVCVAHPQEGP
jgi:hypothetical protein